MRGFASDNYAPVHPEVMAAIAEANAGHAVAYGDDPWTERAVDVVRGHLGPTAEPFLVFNGTGANVVALQTLLRPWQAVICSATAHINVDEGGAPERLLGSKLIDLPTPDGKLTPDLVTAAVTRVGDEHAVQPRVVSVTQSTELGTRYELDELRALADTAHALGLLLHVDGARIANAAASLGVSLGATTSDVGVDVVSLGATKNGAMGAEAVVFLTPGLADAVPWVRKSSMQLASKHRYLAAQFVALLDGDLWRRNAEHANAMAARLAAAVRDLPGLRLTQQVQANAVFAELPAAAIPALQAEFPFYVWDEARHEVRWMCSWDTTEADVDAFGALIRTTLTDGGVA
jgi:threonine aldolase